MKKILCGISAVLLILIFCAGAFVFKSINYTARTDITTFDEILSGFSADKTTINDNTGNRDYYAVLSGYEYENLSLTRALGFLAKSGGSPSYTFASSAAAGAEVFDSAFFLGQVVIIGDELYLYVTYIGDGFEHTVYRAKGGVDTAAFNAGDLEPSEITGDILRDACTRIRLFFSENAYFVIILAALALFCIFFLIRLKKRNE